MILNFTYPVYPTKTQEATLLGWFDHLCELQNSARHDRLVAYETEGRFVSLSDQQTLLTQAREKYDDFREVPQDFQNHALRRNDKAFANFRRRCKENAACGKKSPKKLSLAIRTFDCRFCGTVLDRDHNAAINILLRAACALRGERWVTNLYETRNTNEARDTGLETAEQLLFREL